MVHFFLTWSAKDTAGDNLKKLWRSGEREGIVGEDDGMGGGYRGAPCCDSTVLEALFQTAGQPAGP